ncbi:MAG: hypothetical protein JWN89_98 [Parcubacteria group bacterium]|nr:hypothetical protein [Parcubacteria group bacterium]
MHESNENVSSNEEAVQAELKKGQIGYVDKHGSFMKFDTPEQLAEYRSEENDPSNR